MLLYLTIYTNLLSTLTFLQSVTAGTWVSVRDSPRKAGSRSVKSEWQNGSCQASNSTFRFFPMKVYAFLLKSG